MSEECLLPEFYRVAAKKAETDNTFTLNIHPSQERKVDFSPGQFNMLYAFGIGEVPISMSRAFSGNGEFVHTIKIVGKVTEALCRLEVGDQIGVRGPFGTRWPTHRLKGKNIVLVAGGIGLAPLRPLLECLLENREDFGEINLLYGARDPGDILFVQDLERWKKVLEGRVHKTVDFADVSWQGNVGVVTDLIPQAGINWSNAASLICGPEIMMRFTIQELLRRGLREEDIFLSMERNMKCAIGHCGRCQFVSNFICKDGPVFCYSKVKPFFGKKEI